MRFPTALILAFCGTAAAAWQATAGPVAGEYEVKAAFLYNFARFVEWPSAALPAATTPLTLCVLGDDPFGADLDRAVDGKDVNGHPLVVKRLKEFEDAVHCHIVFIATSDRTRLLRSLDGLRHASVLTVGETDDFLQLGGIINFDIRDNRVRFGINVAAATRAGIKISSKLLRLAESVVGQPGSGT
jgi:hypothetical protein